MPAVKQLDRTVDDPVAGGFYTVHEAARLLNIPHTRRILGWLKGYPRRAAGPVIERQYQPIGKTQELGFWDLIEVRFVDHFRKQGVSVHALRKAAQTARQELNQTHPFATSNAMFLTDRKEVFLKTAKEVHDTKLLNLVTRQFEIYVALEEVLARNIAFDPVTGLAERWRPEPKKYPHIIIDPLLAYGHPVIDETGVPTAAIYALWKAENGDFQAAAEWFELDETLAREAIEYELELPS